MVGESNKLRRGKLGLAIFIGFIIPFAVTFAPTAEQHFASRVAGIALFPASASQQTFFEVTTYINSQAIGTTVPTSLELASLYQNYTSSSRYSLQVEVSGSVSSGSNVTLNVVPDFSVNSTIFGASTLNVFLISPSGLVVATWPKGDALSQVEFGTNQPVGFSAPGNYYPEGQSIYNSFSSGSLWFSYPIPKATTSTGTWEIYAFFASAGGFYAPKSPAVGATSFEVAAGSTEPAILGSTYSFLEFVGTWSLIAGIVKYGLERYPKKWIIRNWPIILGAILLLIYIILRFVIL